MRVSVPFNSVVKMIELSKHDNFSTAVMSHCRSAWYSSVDEGSSIPVDSMLWCVIIATA